MSVNSQLFKKMSTNLSTSYNSCAQGGVPLNEIWNTRLTMAYTVLKKHNLNFALGNQLQLSSSKGTSNNVTGTLGYSWGFWVWEDLDVVRCRMIQTKNNPTIPTKNPYPCTPLLPLPFHVIYLPLYQHPLFGATLYLSNHRSTIPSSSNHHAIYATYGGCDPVV